MNTSLILSSSLPAHYAIIDRADLQPSTKAKYQRAIDQMNLSGVNPADHDQLANYAASLSASSRSFLKAALTILFEDTVTRLEASANPANLAQVQAALLNISAMQKTII